MVDSVKQDGTSTTTTVAAGAAKKGVRGYLTGGLVGGAVVGGTAVALGRAISKIGDGVKDPRWEAAWKTIGGLVSWGGGATGAVMGAGAGAHLGGIVGALDGVGEGIEKAGRNNAAAQERQEDLAQAQINKIVEMQDKQLAMNAQNAYNEGIQTGMMAAAHVAHAGMGAPQPEVPAEEPSVQLGAPGTFTARVHPQSALKVEMAPAQGTIKPEAVAAAQEEAAASIPTR